MNGGMDGIHLERCQHRVPHRGAVIPYAMINGWLKIERHGISRQTTIIVAVAAVIFAVAIAAGAVWMHLALMSR
jgi:hypothetical protein